MLDVLDVALEGGVSALAGVKLLLGELQAAGELGGLLGKLFCEAPDGGHLLSTASGCCRGAVADALVEDEVPYGQAQLVSGLRDVRKIGIGDASCLHRLSSSRGTTLAGLVVAKELIEREGPSSLRASHSHLIEREGPSSLRVSHIYRRHHVEN